MSLNQQFNAMHSNLIRLSKQNDCPASVFIKLSELNASNAHYYLAEGLKNPNLDKKVLEELVHSNITEIIQLIAQYSNCSKKAFNFLYETDNPFLLDKLALNPYIPKELLSKLLRYNNAHYSNNVRMNALKNKNTTLEDITPLLYEEEYIETIKDYVATINNPKIIEEIYNIDTESKRHTYIYVIARNKNTTDTILTKIVEKHHYDNSKLMELIIDNPNAKESLLDIIRMCPELEEKVCEKIKTMNMDDTFIRHAIQCSRSEVLKYISKLNISKDNFIFLFKTIEENKYYQKIPISTIYLNLLENNNTPPEILTEIDKISTSYNIFYNHILKNPNCPRQVFEKYYKTAKDRKKDKEAKNIVHLIATNPNTPIDILVKIYCDYGLTRKLYLTTEYFGNNLNRLKQHLYDMQHKKYKEMNDAKPEIPIEEKITTAKSELSKAEIKKQEKIKEIMYLINSLQIAIQKLEETSSLNEETAKSLFHNILVPDNILLQKVDDHYEINQEFLKVLKLLNLRFISTKDLKVSNIDFRDTNIEIDPQQVYKKDLSNSSFDDQNIFGSFKNVNICGADISNETFPIDIENAIIDENTLLPKAYQVRKH